MEAKVPQLWNDGLTLCFLKAGAMGGGLEFLTLK